MITRKLLFLIGAAALLSSCATQPPPVITPAGEDRYLIDPRSGYAAVIEPSLARRFQAAWNSVLAGNEGDARQQLADIDRRAPGFLPAKLAGAALDIRADRLDHSRRTIEDVLTQQPDYLAARVYQAEIALLGGNTRAAWEIYRSIATGLVPAVVRERAAEVEERLFTEVSAAAHSASDSEAIALLRDALAIRPSSVERRIELVQRLVAQRQFEVARTEIDPLLNVAADRAEVQELLGEIEVSRGKYQEAILRFDRLAKRTSDPRHIRRLQEIKREWSAANMPPHFRVALDSQAVTRAELATLLYWTVPSVRFARNLSAPPIAVDIEDVGGREEIIRAIAIGLYDVDLVTRRVGPHRIVTASRLANLIARLMTLRGAECARGVPTAGVLAACGIDDPFATHPADAPITGKEAARLLELVAAKL